LYEAVRDRINRDMPSIIDFLDRLRPFMADATLDRVPTNKADETGPYWLNGYFSGDDARLLVAFIGAFRPRTIMEVGSGNSTKFARLAVREYRSDTQIVSIDPQPRADIDAISDVVVRSSLLELDIRDFDRLGPGDLLFHDGSHLALRGTDTVHLFLEVLPRIKPGVIVHIHDIALPMEYPPEFAERGYGEQYMLAALLLTGDSWEVLAPAALLTARGTLRNGGMSFWMRRR